MHNPYQPTTMEAEGDGRVRFDGSYFLDPRGILRIGEIIVAFVGYCILLVSHLNIFLIGEYLCSVSVAGICITAAFLVIYVFHVVEAYSSIPWLQIEFGTNAVVTAFYVAAAVLSTYSATDVADFISCAVISYIQVILYGADTIINLSSLRSRKQPLVPQALMYQRAPYILN